MIFLICALALPPMDKTQELRMLRDYLYNHSPGYSFFFSATVRPPQEFTWEKLGIEYDGVKIWRRLRIGA